MWLTYSYTPHFGGDKDRALLLYGIKKGLKSNVGGWIYSNIHHTIQQGFGVIPHPTLLTELIASHGIDNTSLEVFQPKSLLNPKVIKQIVTLELRQYATRASFSGARASQPARPSQPRATIADLAQAYEQ